MISKRDEKLLLKGGFERFENYWEKGDWSIVKSKVESKDIRANFEEGYRICLMYDDGGSYVLSNISDDGVWLCNSIDICLDIVNEEDDSLGDEIVKL